MKRGAADLKQRLQEASAAQQLMVLLWTSTADERACNEAVRNLKRVAGGYPGQRLFVICSVECFNLTKVCAAF